MTRRSLSRRTFLAGSGACLALPWLEATSPARAAGTPRALFVFAPNGVHMPAWTPAATGMEFDLPPTLKPLAPVRTTVRVVSGLELDPARSHGDGPGDHARAAAAFLTCAHPRKNGPLRVGVSVDQLLARAWRGHARFDSLELGVQRGSAAGVCDSGYSCAYSNHIAWRAPGSPLAVENDPRRVFTRLFGAGDATREDRVARRARRRSVLDAVLADADALSRRLGAADRAKLEDYLTAVREVERRIEWAEQRDAEVAEAAARREPPEWMASPVARADRLALLYELIAIAWQSDAARVCTLMLGTGGSNLSYPELGIDAGHHSLSHHRGNADNMAKIERIDRAQIEQLAAFLARLDQLGLLEDAVVVYGSGISDGNRHDHADLPILVAGGGGGLGSAQHLRVPPATPLANLYLELLRRFGVEVPRFGDSTGGLPAL